MKYPGICILLLLYVVEPEYRRNGMQVPSELAREAASLVQQTSSCVVVSFLMMREGGCWGSDSIGA